MWSLGKVFKSPEVSRVYISSFWKHPYCEKGAPVHEIFDQEKEDLFRDMLDIPRYAAVRRINEVVKRARTVKVHALLCATIRKMMPQMWGGERKQREIVDNLDVVFTAVSMEHGIPPGDFPDVAVYRTKLNSWLVAGKSLKTMPKLDKGLIDALDSCLRTHLSELMSILSHAEQRGNFDRGFLDHRPMAGVMGTPPQEAGQVALLRAPEEQVGAVRGSLGEEVEEVQAGWSGGRGRSGGGRETQLRDTQVKVLSGGGGRGGRVTAHEESAEGSGGGRSQETGKRVMAHKGYTAAGEDEISFEAGEVIVVTEEHPSGWWKGHKLTKQGQIIEGLFPSNTVSS